VVEMYAITGRYAAGTSSDLYNSDSQPLSSTCFNKSFTTTSWILPFVNISITCVVYELFESYHMLGKGKDPAHRGEGFKSIKTSVAK